LKAKIYNLQGNFDLAIGECEKLIVENKKRLSALLLMAQVFRKKDDFLLADNLLNRYSLDYQDNRKFLSEKLKVEYLMSKDVQIIDKISDLAKKAKFKKSDVLTDFASFFSKQNNELLTYDCLNKIPNYIKNMSISDEEIEKHIMLHMHNEHAESMHSIFNFNVNLDLVRKLINNIPRTYTLKNIDAYQIYCPNAGYMELDNTIIMNDYISVKTMPFHKEKVITAYPSCHNVYVPVTYETNKEDLMQGKINIKRRD
jgi:hypothetical protein